MLERLRAPTTRPRKYRKLPTLFAWITPWTANKKRFTIFCQSKLSLEIYLHPSSWKSRWLTSATCVSLVFVVFSSRPPVAPPQRAPSRDPSLSSLIFVARVVDLIATFVFYGAFRLSSPFFHAPPPLPSTPRRVRATTTRSQSM